MKLMRIIPVNLLDALVVSRRPVRIDAEKSPMRLTGKESEDG